jgi:hypothetical protein
VQAAKSVVGGDEAAVRDEAIRIRAQQQQQQQPPQEASDRAQQPGDSDELQPLQSQTAAADLSAVQQSTVLEAAAILEEDDDIDQLDVEGIRDFEQKQAAHQVALVSAHPALKQD